MKQYTYIILLTLATLIISCSKDQGDPFADLVGPNSPATAQNMDGELLKEMLVKAKKGDFGEIQSIIIVRNGDIVVEEYFRGWNSTTLHPVYSVTKSVTSLLIGIAIDKGYIAGTDKRLLSFFPEYSSYSYNDNLKAAITLDNVLTMTSGFKWDWEGDELEFNQSRPDWIKYILDLPVSSVPCTQFNYNSGSSLLLSVVIQNTTGKSAGEFARENLFDRIGIFLWTWGVSGRVGFPNFNDTSGGLALRPIDMANLGMLMLQKGRRGSTQIISEAWIEESTRIHVQAGETTEYGYKWWRFTNKSTVAQALQVNDIYFAWGAAGQFIFVMPHLNMVVVSTAENFETIGREFFEVLRDYILTAVQDK